MSSTVVDKVVDDKSKLDDNDDVDVPVIKRRGNKRNHEASRKRKVDDDDDNDAATNNGDGEVDDGATAIVKKSHDKSRGVVHASVSEQCQSVAVFF